MATAESIRSVPASLSERFLAVEAPTFEALRTEDDVTLWRSRTAAHVLHGLTRPSKVRYHVSIGEEAIILMMSDPEMAVANFEASVKRSKDVAASRAQQPAGGFNDPRIFLVRTDDERCGRYWDESAVGYEQAHDGPVFAVVGRRAPDERLQKLADHFGFSLEKLRAFREQAYARDMA